jgi:hypothetical protein
MTSAFKTNGAERPGFAKSYRKGLPINFPCAAGRGRAQRVNQFLRKLRKDWLTERASKVASEFSVMREEPADLAFRLFPDEDFWGGVVAGLPVIREK